jgi:hypothetical protein
VAELMSFRISTYPSTDRCRLNCHWASCRGLFSGSLFAKHTTTRGFARAKNPLGCPWIYAVGANRGIERAPQPLKSAALAPSQIVEATRPVRIVRLGQRVGGRRIGPRKSATVPESRRRTHEDAQGQTETSRPDLVVRGSFREIPLLHQLRGSASRTLRRIYRETVTRSGTRTGR